MFELFGKVYGQNESFEYEDDVKPGYSKRKDKLWLRLVKTLSYFFIGSLFILGVGNVFLNSAIIRIFVNDYLKWSIIPAMIGLVVWYLMSRKCPQCELKMNTFRPNYRDYKTSHKFICHPCKIYIDLKYTNTLD